MVDGKLWFMGGDTVEAGGTDNVTIYDPANDTWATGTPLPRALGHCHAVMHDGELHLTGHSHLTPHHMVYRQGAWQTAAGQRPCVGGSCASVLLG